MKRLLLTGLLVAAASVWAQAPMQAPDRSAELDKAYEQARTAYTEL